MDQLFRSLHSKHAIWQQTCFPERTRHYRTKVLGSPAAKVTRSSDTNPVREKGSTPTHPRGRLGNHAASELLGKSQRLHWNTWVRPLHAHDAGPMTSFTHHLGTFKVQETHFKLLQQNPNLIQQKIDLKVISSDNNSTIIQCSDMPLATLHSLSVWLGSWTSHIDALFRWLSGVLLQHLFGRLTSWSSMMDLDKLR